MLQDISNVAPYQRVIETDTNGFLVRQYFYSSLYDRLSTRPFLEDIEKKWIAFQLLCALRDCHARDVFHGDIKTENILVTSWNWLYLTDFSSSFKPTTLPDDNPADFSYFFDTAGRRTCYLAPERFITTGAEADTSAKVTWAMDVFSAGCVIAELFLEAPTFNLSQLYRYRKGEYNPAVSHFDRIADKDVRDLVTHMIQVEPEARYSAEEYLNFWKGKVFPDYFYSFLHQYMALITDPSSGRSPLSGASVNLGEADERIDRVYYDFDKISYFLGYEEDKQLSEPPAQHTGLGLFPLHLNIPGNQHAAATSRRPADDGTLIFLTLVVASLRNTARATGRVRACDLLLAFAEYLTDEAKLDRVLPYLVTLLNDKAEIVKIAAVRSITQLLSMVNVISPVNAPVFPEYVLPRLQYFIGASASALERSTYAACLDSLATTAARFLDMVVTLRADGSLPTSDQEQEEKGMAVAPFYGEYDAARIELMDVFEAHTKALITDSDSSVRQAFLGSVPELCMFFGTTESNDIILSHLNTYLNDRDWMLKCAFFETIVGVATYLGGTSLEEFILPLMVQALTDPEEFVVDKVLRSLASMAELGLFQRSKTWELVDIVGRFTMHPNIWIREAAAMFLASSSKFLSKADALCIFLPLIRPYLKTPVYEFSELQLLNSLKRPLPRSAFSLAVDWAGKVEKGIFWKPAHQAQTFSFPTTQAIPTTFGKDLALPSLSRIPKNEEDEQWLARLRSMGMTADDDFKLLALREYIWRMARSRLRDSSDQQPSYLNSIINLRNFGITPQTVMFDDQKALVEQPTPNTNGSQDPVSAHVVPQTIADALLDASRSIDDPVARRKRSAMTNSPVASSPLASSFGTRRGTLHGPPDVPSSRLSDDDTLSVAETASTSNNLGSPLEVRRKPSAMALLNRKETAKSVPDTATTSATAFGKVEGPFSHPDKQVSPLVLAKEKDDSGHTDIRYRAAHTYSGNDPSILRMLDSMYIDHYPNDIVEFGPLVSPISRRKAINRSSVQAVDKPWRPEGILVATFAEHVGAINRVVVSPDHVFFITGGDDGAVRVWDTARLERNIAHHSRQTHRHAGGAKVTALCFVENTHCFVSCAADGGVNVVKVDYVYSGGVGTGRYGKLKVLREYQLGQEEFAVWVEHYRSESSSVLVMATNQSRVVALDLRTMKVLYTLENPVHHGAPTCFVMDRKHHWLLLGTSHGVLDLWDLRFKVRLKAWGVPGATAIYRICMHPFKGRGRWVCVAGGCGQGEVTVWDVEKTQCREVYRASGSRDGPKGYEPWSVDEDKPEGMLDRFATALGFSGSANADRGVRAMVAGTDAHEDGRDSKYGFVVTGGSDRKLRFWDLAHVDDSKVVSGLEADEAKPTFSASHPTATLTLSTERPPRPTAPNAASGTKVSSAASGKSAGGRPSRSTVISVQQQHLLKSHLDSILDIALLESPYGMTVSVDRSGCIYVFQ